jgi:hypothetical protein
MTTLVAEWQIGTVDLRRGLAAVLPHINPDPDQAVTHRVRIEVGAELLLIATDGYTAGLYAADATHIRTYGLDYVDLSPADIAKILAVFKAGKDEDADYPESVLEFTVTEKLVTIRDISGMFAGHELELPATPPADFPNVAEMLAGRLTAAADAKEPRLVQVGHKMMARFTASGKAMAGPLAIDTEGTPFVVTCGEEFVGLIMPVWMAEPDRQKIRDRQQSWGLTASRLASATSNRQAGAAALPELLIEAIRAVGVRQSATVTGLAEALSIDKATATDLLDQMYRAQLIGPPKRGRSREVLYSPDEVDRALASLVKDEDPLPVEVADEAVMLTKEAPGADLAEGEYVTAPECQHEAWEEDRSGARRCADCGTMLNGPTPPPEFADPFDQSVPPPPPEWRDSDGNPWPTSPFGDA